MKFDLKFIENESDLKMKFGNTQMINEGQNGATFTPSVSVDGVISWTNDKGLENPAPVNIKGKNGKDAIIDQTYNPESENAQSGKAVAEALVNVGGGGGSDYVLLCETTITAEDISEAGENGIIRLVVGGEEEQFKGVRELVLDLYMPANDQKNFKFYAGFSADGTSNIAIAQLIRGQTDAILPIDTTKTTRTKLITQINASGKFMYSLLIRSIYGSLVYPNPSVGCVSYLSEDAGMENCNYIYCSGGGFKFPEGTIFKVYGRY